jgi:cytohesin
VATSNKGGSNRRRANSDWPLIWLAAMRGDVDEIRRLISSGADSDAVGDQETTPLHVAAIYGQAGAVEALLTAGADPNRVDGHGNGPLWAAVHQACLARRTEKEFTIVRLLLGRGADPESKNRYGLSPRDRANKGDATIIALIPPPTALA